MSWSNELRAACAGLALCACALPAAAGTLLANRLAEAIRGGEYVAAGADELARAEHLFGQLAAGASPEALAGEGLALDVVIERDGPLTVVRERDDARRGRGFYVFRDDARPDVLQVPHGFKDEMTRDIGLALFREGSFSAAAWNTVPRDYERDGTRVDADLAHLPATWFTAFARAAARAWPEGRSLQIHGFEPDKRRSETGAAADLILSDGTNSPGDALRRQRDCLARGLGRNVALYGDGLRELGGTTNVQAQALRGIGYAGFVHVEISRALRRALRDDAATRATFLACLQP
jgi:hypothetical protein